MPSHVRTIVEITDSQIRLFQSKKAASGRVLTFFDVRDIGNLSEAAIGQLLMKMLKWKAVVPISLGELIVIIPRQQAIVHAVLLPSIDPKELREMAELQAAQHIPYGKEDIVLDILPVTQTPDGFTHLFLVAVPKDRVEYYWRIFQAAKMTPARMTISSIGISQWYKNRILQMDEVVMLVNIDEQMSEISIYDQGKISTLRVASWGAVECREGRFDELVRQIEMTKTYYQREKVGRDPASILVVSSLENDVGLCERISKEFSLPVGFKRVISDVAMKKDVKWPRIVIDAGCSVTAGLGLALAKDTSKLIDFIPVEIKEKQAKINDAQRMIRIGIFVGMALICLGASFAMSVMQENAVIKRLNDQIHELKPVVAKYEKNSKHLEELKTAFAERVLFVRIISELDHLLTPDMSLLSLSIAGGKVMTMQGYTRESQSINLLQKSMADSGVFTNVTLDYVNKKAGDKGELNYFKISCQVKGGGA